MKQPSVISFLYSKNQKMLKKKSTSHSSKNITSNNTTKNTKIINNVPTSKTHPKNTSSSSYLRDKASPSTDQRNSPLISAGINSIKMHHLEIPNPYAVSIHSKNNVTNLDEPSNNQIFSRISSWPESPVDLCNSQITRTETILLPPNILKNGSRILSKIPLSNLCSHSNQINQTVSSYTNRTPNTAKIQHNDQEKIVCTLETITVLYHM